MINQKYTKLSIYLSLIILGLTLTACPHIAYNKMKENMEKAKRLNERKPNYTQNIKDGVNISDLEQSSDTLFTGRPANDSTFKELSANSNYEKSVSSDTSNATAVNPNNSSAHIDQSDPFAMEKAIKKDKTLQSVFDNNLNIPNKENITQKSAKEINTDSAASGNDVSHPSDSIVHNSHMPKTNANMENTEKSSSDENVWTVKINSLDDSNYPEYIDLRIQIVDTSGRNISGLAPPYFKGKGSWRKYWSTLSDSCSGIHQINDFTVEEVTQKNDIKNAMTFVLDHSGSMGSGKIYLLNRALARILTALNRQDYVSVIKFATDNHVQIPLSNNKKYYVTTFKNQLDEDFNIGGGTRMYDALHAGINELKKAPEGYRRSLILLSDGGDNSAKSVLDSAVQACRKNNISIIAIDFDYDNELMREVAVYTGGTYYKIYSIKEFPFVFRDLYYSLNNYYQVRYTPPECAGIHKVNLEVGSPVIRHLRGTASGYYDKSIITKFDAAGTTAMLNIEFETGSAELSESSKEYIKQLYDILKNNPKMRLSINGHTDDVGAPKDNYLLSLDRAKSVKRELVNLGIDADRLETKGFGETAPLVPNDSDENRRLNRRTEFIVIAND